MKVFLSIQQKLSILTEAYHAQGVLRSTAHKYNVDLVQIRQWKKNLAGMDGNVESSEVLYIFQARAGQKRLFTMGRAASMLSTMELFVSCLIPKEHLDTLFL